MLPPKNSPKWTKFLNDLGTIAVNDLSAKMMMNRIKMKIRFDGSEAVKQQAITEAYDFFAKNEAALKGEIDRIFG